MKKLLSLVFALVMLAYAMPASAELKISGDALVFPRYESRNWDGNYVKDNEDDMKYLYRVRLKAAADLGEGYFFKSLISSESPGWLNTVGHANSETYTLGVSQFYFGRMQEDCHYMVGRLPLNSWNNPVFDLALYSFAPIEFPVFLWNNDRVFGLNYGMKVGPGDLNATLVVLDNDVTDDSAAEGDGLFNDGYALHLMYKTNLGDVTFEPQLVAGLTNQDVYGLAQGSGAPVVMYTNVTPMTVGANLTVPAGDAKFTLSGFYTFCDDTEQNAAPDQVDFDGYLLRVKGEVGPFTAWVDYNNTSDSSNSLNSYDYNNLFVFAQYKFNVYQSAAGSFSVSPTIRYYSTDYEDYQFDRLRAELWANVTF
jgi:hypothetical protein